VTLVTSIFLVKNLATLTGSVHLFDFLFHPIHKKSEKVLSLGPAPNSTRLAPSRSGLEVGAQPHFNSSGECSTIRQLAESYLGGCWVLKIYYKNTMFAILRNSDFL
jgi:hypothetical protein